MVIRRQVVMPPVVGKKIRRTAHSNDQVSPQPRKMVPGADCSQVPTAQHVSETVRATKAPAMQVHIPGLPGRKRVGTQEGASGGEAGLATDIAACQLQLQLTAHLATRHDTLEHLRLQKWEKKCLDLLNRYSLMVKL